MTHHKWRLHKGGDQGVCSICGQEFNSKEGLKYHLWRVHHQGANGIVMSFPCNLYIYVLKFLSLMDSPTLQWYRSARITRCAAAKIASTPLTAQKAEANWLKSSVESPLDDTFRIFEFSP